MRLGQKLWCYVDENGTFYTYDAKPLVYSRRDEALRAWRRELSDLFRQASVGSDEPMQVKLCGMSFMDIANMGAFINGAPVTLVPQTRKPKRVHKKKTKVGE